MLCSHISSRCSVDDGSPTFRENLAYDSSPLFLRRKEANCFSNDSAMQVDIAQEVIPFAGYLRRFVLTRVVVESILDLLSWERR
jgi:hypothetical protein